MNLNITQAVKSLSPYADDKIKNNLNVPRLSLLAQAKQADIIAFSLRPLLELRLLDRRQEADEITGDRLSVKFLDSIFTNGNVITDGLPTLKDETTSRKLRPDASVVFSAALLESHQYFKQEGIQIREDDRFIFAGTSYQIIRVEPHDLYSNRYYLHYKVYGVNTFNKDQEKQVIKDL